MGRLLGLLLALSILDVALTKFPLHHNQKAPPTSSNQTKTWKWRDSPACDAACITQGVICGFKFKQCCMPGMCSGLFWKTCDDPASRVYLECAVEGGEYSYEGIRQYRAGESQAIKDYSRMAEKDAQTKNLVKQVSNDLEKQRNITTISRDSIEAAVKNGIQKAVKNVTIAF